MVSDADAASALEAADGLRVWRGLLATAELSFGRAMDLSKLLRVLANTQRSAGFLRRTMAHHGTGRATEQSLSAPHMDGRSRGQRKKTIAEVDQTV